MLKVFLIVSFILGGFCAQTWAGYKSTSDRQVVDQNGVSEIRFIDGADIGTSVNEERVDYLEIIGCSNDEACSSDSPFPDSNRENQYWIND